jgi:hypothetical protein
MSRNLQNITRDRRLAASPEILVRNLAKVSVLSFFFSRLSDFDPRI